MSENKPQEQGKLYYMTKSLTQMFGMVPKDVYATMKAKLEYWISEYHQARMRSNDVSTAFNFHLMMDESTEERIAEVKKAKEPVTCKQGCHFCCFVHVVITEDEGKLLLGYAAEEKLTFDMDRINKQAEFDNDNWTKQKYADRACPFLDPLNHTCKVYKHRPASCRAHYVVSDPKLCDTKIVNAQTHRLFDLETNLMASAAMNASPSGGMAKILKKLLTPSTPIQ